MGNDKQDALEAEKDPSSAEPVIDAVEDEEQFGWNVATDPAEPETVQEPEEPEPITLTLDEFMEKRNEARAKALELLGEVKTRNISVEKEFAGLTTKGDDHEDDYMGGGKAKTSSASTKKDQRSTGKTQIVDLSFKFDAPVASSDDRNGRGGGRGDRSRGGGDRSGGGRGGGRRPQSSSGNSSVFNALDFPSL